MPWGHHLVVNAAGCSPVRIRCAPSITQFAKTLVKRIDMVPYGDPQVVHFGSGNKAGFITGDVFTGNGRAGEIIRITNNGNRGSPIFCLSH